MENRLIPILVFFFSFIQGCAIHKPCSEAGDTTWNPKITGDKRCGQKKNNEGKVVNNGPFYQYYQSNRRLALEGHFENGLKQGVWLHYGEDGNLKSAKFFQQGVEKTPDVETQKEIDRLIQQNTGIKR